MFNPLSYLRKKKGNQMVTLIIINNQPNKQKYSLQKENNLVANQLMLFE